MHARKRAFSSVTRLGCEEMLPRMRHFGCIDNFLPVDAGVQLPVIVEGKNDDLQRRVCLFRSASEAQEYVALRATKTLDKSSSEARFKSRREGLGFRLLDQRAAGVFR